MEVWKEKLEIAVGRAEEYRLLGRNHVEGLKVHVECIKDLMKALMSSLKRQSTADDEGDRALLTDAMKTLKNLQSELADAEHKEGGSIRKFRAKLEEETNSLLPFFDGDEESEFDDFLLDFEYFIELNPSLSDVEKMVLLRSCLVEDALNAIDDIPTTARNYSLAWELLKYMFDPGRDTAEMFRHLVALRPVSMNDGVEFQKRYWELESILQSMDDSGCVNTDKDQCIRFLYLKKFSEETSLTILLKDADMLLPEIRKEVLHLVCVKELHTESGLPKNNAQMIAKRKISVNCRQNKPENCPVPNKEPVKSQTGATDTKKNGSSTSEQLSYESEDDLIWGESSLPKTLADAFATTCTFTTVCATVSRAAGKKRFSTTVRLLLQNLPPVSLITASAALRLGIKASGPKTLRLRGTAGGSFTATKTYYKLALRVNNRFTDYIKVHIVDENAMNFTADDIPAVDVADFKKAHPHLAHLDLPDTGKGRPVELFLSGEYWRKYLNHLPDSEYPRLSGDWQLESSQFGWLVGHGKVKCNSFVICSYRLEKEDLSVVF